MSYQHYTHNPDAEGGPSIYDFFNKSLTSQQLPPGFRMSGSSSGSGSGSGSVNGGAGTSGPASATANTSITAKRRTIISEEYKHTPTLSVLTYNVWAADTYIAERIYRIIEIVKDKMPDIVCLQELTPASYSIIFSRLSSEYQIFQAFTASGYPEGSCLLCKNTSVHIVKNDINPYYYDYDGCTFTSKQIIGCEIEFVKYPELPHFHILTTQLETSYAKDNLRKKQADILIDNVTSSLHDFILTGDFQIYDKQEYAEDKLNSTAARLQDAWVSMGCPTRVKYTYNCRRNVLIKDKIMERFDRIYYYSQNKLFTPISYSIIGKDNIHDSLKFPPSTHYGVLVTFTISSLLV